MRRWSFVFFFVFLSKAPFKDFFIHLTNKKNALFNFNKSFPAGGSASGGQYQH